MKKIIVTGGLGFIGSNLVHMLIKKKFFVINIDKVSYASNFYNLKNLPKKNYKFIKLDICNKKKLQNILRFYKPKCIFNLAAETHVDRSIDGPKNFINSNIIGTFNLLECFREHIKNNNKSKLIHISTDEVYGDVLHGRSKESLKDYVDSAMNGLISVSDAPFRLIIIAGFIVSAFSLTYGMYALIYNLIFKTNLVQGLPTILISVLIFSGLQLLVLGFIGEYVTSLHRKIKKDIEVNEKEKINF